MPKIAKRRLIRPPKRDRRKATKEVKNVASQDRLVEPGNSKVNQRVEHNYYLQEEPTPPPSLDHIYCFTGATVNAQQDCTVVLEVDSNLNAETTLSSDLSAPHFEHEICVESCSSKVESIPITEVPLNLQQDCTVVLEEDSNFKTETTLSSDLSAPHFEHEICVESCSSKVESIPITEVPLNLQQDCTVVLEEDSNFNTETTSSSDPSAPHFEYEIFAESCSSKVESIPITEVPLNLQQDCTVVLEEDSNINEKLTVSLDVSDSDFATATTPNLSTDLLKECVDILKSAVPAHWTPMYADEAVQMMKFSSGKVKVLQRSLYIGKDCSVVAHFHGKELPPDHCFYEVIKKINLKVDSAALLANAVLQVVSEYRLFEVCVGIPSLKYKSLWHREQGCYIDSNPFQEIRYQNQTCRTTTCSYAIPQLQRQCTDCNKLQKKFSSRSVFKTSPSPSKPKTPNKFKPFSSLITPEKKKRVALYQKYIRNLKRENSRLREIIDKKIEEESVLVDEASDEDLTSWIQEGDQNGHVLDFHKIFLQQQLQASKLKDKRGMRWHPLMIRFALLIKTISDSAYNAMAQSGFIHLPCQKTLYDYSHAMDVYEGCHPEIIEDVAKIVNACEHPYQQNHVLSFDEVTISQNLVTRKGTGEVIGYCNLNASQTEILELEKNLKDTASEVTPAPLKELPMIKKMLSFMVRGVANGVQSVVASYGVHLLSKEDLHMHVWEVVGNLEMCGIKICAFTCDGCPINRSFFDMHPAATIVPESTVVFDTPNIYDPQRKIYFISDPPHLLKTIRNCLYNSGRKKCRQLKKNGQTMKWSTIVQLYKYKSTQTVKKLFKLTAPCVFLNAWSRMKVALAARVLSLSVANLLESLKWEGTSELCIFEKTNEFFDCLNGKHTSESIKTRKEDLAPYTSVNDHRFKKLQDFLDYLKEWEEEAKAAEKKKEKRAALMLSLPTRVGIEITIRGFTAAVKYLLTPTSEGGAGCKFIMAGVFNQDGLEQYFSKQRGLCGGNKNPTADQFLRNQNKLHLLQGLKTKKKGANTEGCQDPTLADAAPLPKRRKTSRPLLYPIREENV